MAILDNTLEAPVYSTQQKQEFTKNMLLGNVRQAFTQLKTSYIEGFKLITNNPYGLTPEEVFQGLGENATELHRLGQLTVRTLNEANTGSIPPEQTIELPTQE